MANMVLVFLVARIGMWTVGIFLEKSQVALFGVGLQLVSIITMPLFIINSMLSPIIADLYSKPAEHNRLEKIVRSVTTVASLPAIIMLVVFVLYGREFLGFLYGDYYSQAYYILILLALGQTTNVLVGPTGYMLKMTAFHTQLLLINLVFGVITIAGSFLAAQHYDATIVAGVMTTTLILQNILTLYYSKRATGIYCCVISNIRTIKNYVRKGCLLYTSPSPRDRQKSRMPSSA